MKKLLLTLVCTAVFSSPTIAQQITYACQYVESAGLKWDKGNWISARFMLSRPFFLFSVDGGLVQESVSKAIGTQLGFFCNNVYRNVQTCSTLFGHSVVFNHVTYIGGVARLFGATHTSHKRDSLSISTFTCTKM